MKRALKKPPFCKFSLSATLLSRVIPLWTALDSLAATNNDERNHLQPTLTLSRPMNDLLAPPACIVHLLG